MRCMQSHQCLVATVNYVPVASLASRQTALPNWPRFATARIRSRSADRNGSQCETRHCTFYFVCSGNVAKFVDLISCQILEVVKFCDVHSLLHQKIFMCRVPTRASWGCR